MDQATLDKITNIPAVNADGSPFDMSLFYSSNGMRPISDESSAYGMLSRMAAADPAYLPDLVNLIAERENTTQAQNWYERMSSSSYQRAMKDLERAGLNPVLALTSLSGAGSGSVQPAGFTNSNGFQVRSQERISSKEMAMRLLSTGITGLLGLMAISLRKSR